MSKKCKPASNLLNYCPQHSNPEKEMKKKLSCTSGISDSVKALVCNIVDKHLTCPICLDVVTDAHTNPECLHRFCGKCIRESLHKCNHECPTCRVHIPTHRTMRKDTAFEEIKDKMLKIIEVINEEDNDINDDITDFMPSAPLRTKIHNEKKDQSILGSRSSTINGAATVHSAFLSPGKASSRRKRSNDNDYDQTSSYRRATKRQCRYQLVHGVHQLQQETPSSKAISSQSDTNQQRHLEKKHCNNEANWSNSAKLGPVEECDEGNNNDTDLASSAIIQRPKKKPFKSFDDRIKELVAFKAKYGHCDVARSDKLPEYKSLAIWCNHIRLCHKGRRQNRALTPSEVKNLEALGFHWNLLERKAAKTFDKWYKDLVAFKEKFGHCDVPTHFTPRYPEYKALGVWCKCLRQIYKGTAGNRTALTPSNIRDLERIGFKFSFPIKMPKDRSTTDG